MRHLSNFLRVVPFSDFESFDGTKLVASSEPDLLLSLNDLNLDEKPSLNRGGTLYDQSLEVVCQKLSDTLRERYPERTKVVVLLYDDAQQPVLWGGDAYYLRISLAPKTDTDVITLTRKATRALL